MRWGDNVSTLLHDDAFDFDDFDATLRLLSFDFMMDAIAASLLATPRRCDCARDIFDATFAGEKADAAARCMPRRKTISEARASGLQSVNVLLAIRVRYAMTIPLCRPCQFRLSAFGARIQLSIIELRRRADATAPAGSLDVAMLMKV